MPRSAFFVAAALPLLLISGGAIPGAFAAPVAAPISGPSFLDEVNAGFANWDIDHNGVLSPSEIDAAVSNPKISGPEAAAIAAIKRAARIKTANLPDLTLENLRTLAVDKRGSQKAAAESKSADQDSAKTTVNFGRFYNEALKQISQTKHVLFAPGMPSLSVVRQGRVGDCFCLAPLGAMLYRDPKQVASIFSQQPDGTYNVKFGKNVISVAQPTDAEIALTASAKTTGFWVNLYEKAVGLSRIAEAAKTAANGTAATGGASASLASESHTTAAILPVDNIGRGGSAGTMLSVLTGHDIERFSFIFAKKKDTTPEQFDVRLKTLREKLVSAFADNRLVTTGTNKATTPGISSGHAYAVVGYDAATDSVRLWNPHGDDYTPKGPAGLEYGYPRKDGIAMMPLADFVKEYAGVAFELTTDAKGVPPPPTDEN